MLTASIKQSDTQPSLAAILRSDGTPIDLSTAVSVHFHLWNKKTKKNVIDALATVVSAVDGAVRYDWEPGDTDTPGEYLFEFEINFVDGENYGSLTVPNNGYGTLTILPQLDA